MFGTDGRAFHRPLAISVAGLMLAGVGLAVTALVLAVAHRETGQALAYIPVAVGLIGVAVMVLRGTRWVTRVGDTPANVCHTTSWFQRLHKPPTSTIAAQAKRGGATVRTVAECLANRDKQASPA